jgi:methionine sulfoxide reductase heme-binding subunit
MDRSPAVSFFLAPLAFFSVITAYHLWTIPSPDPVYATIRATGILAYASSFFAIVTPAFPKESMKLSGKTFLQVHHVFAVSALLLMVTHAVATWVSFGTPTVFIPHFQSLRGFLLFGGRVALPLFILTALTARYSRKIPFWRKIHLLNYFAFIVATSHAVMIGTDFDSTLMRTLAWSMAAAAVAVPVVRYLRRKRQNPSRG